MFQLSSSLWFFGYNPPGVMTGLLSLTWPSSGLFFEPPMDLFGSALDDDACSCLPTYLSLLVPPNHSMSLSKYFYLFSAQKWPVKGFLKLCPLKRKML